MRSDLIKEGPSRAPHRSLLRALGIEDVYKRQELKRGLKNNTFENYKYMYETFVRHQIGSKTVSSLKKTDIKRFFHYLTDERQLKPSTIDSIHTVLHQILDCLLYTSRCV